MSPYEVPYWVRAVVAGAFFAIVPFVDLLRHRERATRWREYAFWLVCGALGSVFAVFVDAATSRLSPEYFAVGKQLAPNGEPLTLAAIVGFGARVGFVAGMAVGGALLLSNNPHDGWRRLAYRELARTLVFPTLCAVLAAPIVGAAFGWDVQGLAVHLRPRMSEETIQRFLLVQRLHLGLYAGGLVGTIIAIGLIRRRRAVSH